MLKRIPKYRLNLMFVVTVAIFLVRCSAAYYGTMEKLGYHKRDLMVSRVESARDAQQEAKEQFESALEKFSSVLEVDGGELEEKYERLKKLGNKQHAAISQRFFRTGPAEYGEGDVFIGIRLPVLRKLVKEYSEDFKNAAF